GRVCGRATGIKEGKPKGMIADYVELGETGSIGRALATLGFGTLQAGDDLSDEQIVDAPVQRGNSRPPQQLHGQGQRQSQPQSTGGASERQIKAIYGISKGLGW
ncbi:MAG TPA: hypothetical protein VNZ55_12300, partial [Thermomicrobiales bacterium]|nr:hypothetical protein [Thermomicrobiales bacterium]